MPAEWYLPSSATATITVGVARGEIADFRVPPAAEEGDIIGSTAEPLAIGVRNVGTLAGRISLRIRDLDTAATIWTGSIDLAIDEFGWVYPAPSYPMPARDLRLRAEAYHDAVVDSYMDRTITLVVRVETKITLSLEPAAIEPGGTYHYVGRLTRVDTGAGLAGMEIIARRQEAGVWREVGRGTTDAGGYYDIAATAPAEAGSYPCEAAFPGVVPFAAAAARVGLAVPVPIPIMALLPMAVGLGLYAAAIWR